MSYFVTPTGTSLTLADEAGPAAGQVIYNAYGGVLTSTLSLDLATALADQGHLADPATGLVHLGGGRWYDPSLGRPLQPDPAGGPPVVPQALNRYAATALGQPGVMEALVNTWNLFNDPVVSNAGKGALSSSVSKLTPRGLNAYYGASLYTTPGSPLKQTKTVLTSADPVIDQAIVGAGAIGLATRDLIGAPPGSLRARLFSIGQRLFDQAVARNTREIPVTTIIGYELKYHHHLPAGRVAGRLANLLNDKLVGHIFNFGVGLGVDVGYQAWMDYGNPYLTRTEFTGRLFVAGFGSIASFAAGLAAPAIIGGPVTWVGLGAGIIVAISWDVFIAPVIYNVAGLNPERNLAPLQ